MLQSEPRSARTTVWPLPISLAATFGITLVFSSSPYLDVSVQVVPHVYLCIQYTLHRVCLCGFPHSEICGSMDMCSSPQLFAACHVLLRLPVPRHPPDALIRLTWPPGFSDQSQDFFLNYCSVNGYWFLGEYRSYPSASLSDFA